MPYPDGLSPELQQDFWRAVELGREANALATPSDDKWAPELVEAAHRVSPDTSVYEAIYGKPPSNAAFELTRAAAIDLMPGREYGEEPSVESPKEQVKVPLTTGERVRISQNYYTATVTPNVLLFDPIGHVIQTGDVLDSGRIHAIEDIYPLAGEIFAAHYEPGSFSERLIKLAVPTAHGLSTFREKHFEPLGANTMKFVYGDPQKGSGLFTPESVVTGLVKGEFLLSPDPTSVLTYGLGLASIPQVTASVMVEVAKQIQDLQDQDPTSAKKLAANLAQALEYETRFWKDGLAEGGAGIRVLTHFLDQGRASVPHPSVVALGRKFIEGEDRQESKLEVAVGGQVVWEDRETEAYYKKIRDKLSEQPEQHIVFAESAPGFWKKMVGKLTKKHASLEV